MAGRDGARAGDRADRAGRVVIGALALLPHLALMLAAAPVLAGLRELRAPAQVWRELVRLYRKPALWPEHASWFGAAPVASLGASLAAAVLTPSFTLGMASAPLADLVVIAALLLLPRLVLALASFDAGTGEAALAGQRASVLTAAVMPGLFVLVLVVASGGSSNLDAAAAALREAEPAWYWLPAALAVAALLMALEAELGGPFAGRDLALLRFAAQLRLVTALSVVAALLLPFGLARAGAGLVAWLIGMACWAVKLAALGGAAALLRRGRLRPEQLPELAAIGLLLALIAASLCFAGQRAP
jgi:formate hydrogenlyase subunit 4